MLICDKCGTLRGDEEIRKYVEPHGELRYYYGCECGGEYVEARRCRGCGEWFNDTHNHYVCDTCLEEEMTFENAVKYGKENPWEVKVNSFLIYMLGEDGIEKALTEYLALKALDKDVKDFCSDDKGAFADFVLGLYGERMREAHIRPQSNSSVVSADEIEEIASSATDTIDEGDL